MGVTSAFRRGLLRSAKAAATNGTTLPQALIALESSRFEEVAEGRFLVGTTSENKSVTFGLPPVGDASLQAVHEGADSLLLLYDQIYADGGATDDESVYARMMKAICAVRRFGASFYLIEK